jgi:3-isopropylmalate dehydrogenase
MIVSGQMLLAWLGRKRDEAKAVAAAEHIKAAVEKVLTDASHLTPDLGGKASTEAMGDAIAAATQQ